MKKKWVVVIVFLAILLVGVIGVIISGDEPILTPTPTPTSLSPSEIAAIQEYTDTIIDKLDVLYEDFEQGQPEAKRISDEMQAPYYMAIGYMAVVRATANEVKALSAPQGAEEIRQAAINKLRSLQEGLNEIAEKDAADVSLSDPVDFYIAYLRVLADIPDLKNELRELTDF